MFGCKLMYGMNRDCVTEIEFYSFLSEQGGVTD